MAQRLRQAVQRQATQPGLPQRGHVSPANSASTARGEPHTTTTELIDRLPRPHLYALCRSGGNQARLAALRYVAVTGSAEFCTSIDVPLDLRGRTVHRPPLRRVRLPRSSSPCAGCRAVARVGHLRQHTSAPRTEHRRPTRRSSRMTGCSRADVDNRESGSVVPGGLPILV